MKCSCGEDAVYVDDRPGANTVGFCHLHLPEGLRPIAEQLVVRPEPAPAGELEPTGVGEPVPLESTLRVGEHVLPAALAGEHLLEP